MNCLFLVVLSFTSHLQEFSVAKSKSFLYIAGYSSVKLGSHYNM